MTRVRLLAGPLSVDGHWVMRSGLRWLCDDGHVCRPGELIGYCNLAVRPRSPGARDRPQPFAEELNDFQLLFAAPAAGRFRRASDPIGGGYLDRLSAFTWTAEFCLGWLEDTDPSARAAAAAPPLLMAAGRRMTHITGQQHGLLTGWHNRTRAWWGDGRGPTTTMVALGLCELDAMLRGEASNFQELFDAMGGPVQTVIFQHEPLVLCARVALEQLERTPADREAIAEDIARTFAAGPHVPQPADWLFIGALLDMLNRSPLTETYPLLRRDGIEEAGPPDVLLMSLSSEVPRAARHRRLGYTILCLEHVLRQLPPASSHWLRENFEPVLRNTEDIASDCAALAEAVQRHNGASIVALNAVASTSEPGIHSYAGYPAPLSQTLANVRTGELNLMLCDLARSHGFGIVDVDGIAADLGRLAHVPDGIHASAEFQAEIRAEMIHQLAAKDLAAFGGRSGAAPPSADREVADPGRSGGDLVGNGLAVGIRE